MATATPHNLTSLLDKVGQRAAKDGAETQRKLSMGDILAVVGRRAYGPLLLVIGILSVSPLALIPGSTWAFAVLTLLVASQMAINLKHPWLPSAALKMAFKESDISGAIRKVRPWTKAIDKVVKPRLQFLAGEPWLALVALLAIVAALITFPLSLIPFAPFLPGATIILIGLGLTARDGLLLGIAMLIVVGGGYLLLTRWM